MVVDFQGWMYRPIPVCTAMEFVTQFRSHIVHHNNCTMVIFCHWEALHDEASISLPAGTPREGLDDETIRGYLKIREIHCSFYTPYNKQKFELNRFPDYGTDTTSSSMQVGTTFVEKSLSVRPHTCGWKRCTSQHAL